jgi:hypothetical protein
VDGKARKSNKKDQIKNKINDDRGRESIIHANPQ